MKFTTKLSTNQNLKYTNPQNVLEDLKKSRNHRDQFETILFLSKNDFRKGEGGLRTKGYFKYKNNQKTLLTVITVVINNDKHIEETILSVINQSYDNIEYIIIDGGSTDNTINIIKKYDHLIDYWVSETDNGIYDAMNKGCKLATGSGLCFLNSGDKFVGNIISDKSKLPFLIPCKIKENEKKIWHKDVSYKKYGMPTSHQAMVFSNKKLLYNLRYKISSDYDYFIRHGVFFNTSENSGFVLYDNKGLSKRNILLRDIETLSIIKKNYGLYVCLLFLVDRIFKIINKLLKN